MSEIPTYPVIHVDVDAHGGCRVGVAGTHHQFTSDSPDSNRRAVLNYATDLARELRRPVRMHSTEPTGEWRVAVHPDGQVTEIPKQDPPRRPRRARPTANTADSTAAVPRTTLLTPVSDAPALELDEELERTRIAARRSPTDDAAPVVSLLFSDGTAARLAGAALIGRRPSPAPGDVVDATIALHDDSRRLSRSHVRLEWRSNVLVAVDQDSANGTYLRRGDSPDLELPGMEAVEVLDGDVLELGSADLTVQITVAGATERPE